MTTDTEIRVLPLRFYNKDVWARFMSLAKRNGYDPSTKMEDGWWVVTTVFQNKAARSDLLKKWRIESTEGS